MLASGFTLDARQADLLREGRSTVRELADTSGATGGIRAAITSLVGRVPAIRPARLATR